MNLKLLSHVNANSDIIEAWLKYYLQLGVERFHLVVHGGREENSRLFAIKDSYPITIEDTYGGPFLGEHKKNHLDALLARNTEQWVVLVDGDEFVEFPYRNIPKTIQKLNFEHATEMVAPMLQRIKADGGLDTPPLIDGPFEVFPLCSEDLYQRMGVDACIVKYPLFFCGSNTQLEEEGNHHPPRGSERRTSAMRGVTHHFKFRSTVSQRLDKIINSAYLWRHESVQFREYLDSHSNRLPVEGAFPYSRKELFRRGLLRKLSLRNDIRYCWPPMEEQIATVDRPRKTDGIEIHAVGDECAVYDTAADRIHYLNPTAALILEFCDGNHSPVEIAALLQQAYGLPDAPLDEVSNCLNSLEEIGIVR